LFAGSNTPFNLKKELPVKAVHVMLSAMVVTSVLACSKSSTSASSEAGVYVLATVNGESLPAIVTDAGDTAVVVIDTLALTTHNYTRHVVDTLRSQAAGAVYYSHESSGTYTHTGTSITFTDAATDSSVTGTIVDGVITVSAVENGFSVTGVYNKQ
jgi:hypothetical protein